MSVSQDALNPAWPGLTNDDSQGAEAIVMLDLLDGMLLDEADLLPEGSGSDHEDRDAHVCDCCGVAKDDVDVWATDSETGDVVRLCLSCGDW